MDQREEWELLDLEEWELNTVSAPLEARMDPEDAAAELLMGSIEFMEDGCPVGEPPELPALALAA
jgi:hypothetical protein